MCQGLTHTALQAPTAAYLDMLYTQSTTISMFTHPSSTSGTYITDIIIQLQLCFGIKTSCI